MLIHIRKVPSQPCPACYLTKATVHLDLAKLIHKVNHHLYSLPHLQTTVSVQCLVALEFEHVSKSPGTFAKHRLLLPTTSWPNDSGGLGCDVSDTSQMMQMLLVQRPHLENHWSV